MASVITNYAIAAEISNGAGKNEKKGAFDLVPAGYANHFIHEKEGFMRRKDSSLKKQYTEE
jgi:hypothetical protein